MRPWQVVEEEKRARQESEAVEKKAMRHSTTAAGDALTTMKTRSAKIAASSGKVPAPDTKPGEGAAAASGGDGLVPQEATDAAADERWLVELRAVAHALLKGINQKLDADGAAFQNVFATHDNFHVSHGGKNDAPPPPTAEARPCTSSSIGSTSTRPFQNPLN